MRSGHTGNKFGPSEPDRWMQLAVRYLAVRDRTGAQVRQFLFRKGAAPDQIEQIVLRLSDLGYLDDRAYAARWIAGRLSRRPMGREGLRCELEARGVVGSIAQETIRDVFRGIDEETLARLALDATRRTGRKLTPIQSVRLLRHRGFSEETIDRLIRDRIADEGFAS